MGGRRGGGRGGEASREGRGGRKQKKKEGENTVNKCIIQWTDEFREFLPPITHPSVSQSQRRATPWHDPTWHRVCSLPCASRPYAGFSPSCCLRP